ncbi:hypothetical protein [Hymenobacter algoricola]|uniref:Uncharacterized protein n=1 Tax=Hymenobacter algoricola TaxID=486267 RepID=A0ABP7NAT2_9BACT
MPISHYAFRALSLEEQLPIIWQQGDFLAQRFEEEDCINLYHLGTFFVEVYYDPQANCVHRTRTFTSRECLMDYTAYVKLDDLGL